MTLDEMYARARAEDISLYHQCIPGIRAVTIEYQGAYAVCLDLDTIPTQAEELCILAHECGHAMTGSTHKLSSPYDLIQKHENRADKWAIHEMVPPEEYRVALESGCTELWQLAEYFNITEDYARKAVCLYTHGNLAVDLYA